MAFETPRQEACAMICAVYARKSTDDSDRNAEARSTARQIDHATAYAKRQGWTVDPRYIFVDDAVSGAEWKHRPGFNALRHSDLRVAGRAPLLTSGSRPVYPIGDC